MASVVQAQSLTKRYGAKTVLAGVDVLVEQGQTLAVLGRNGAGKTTFLKIVLGLARASSGTISVLGAAPGQRRDAIGYLPEGLALYPHLSALDNFRVAAYAAGLSTPPKEDVLETLDNLGLARAAKYPTRTYSLGMQRRLQLALALAVKPGLELVILDEPTNGLDVDGAEWLTLKLRALHDRGTTVLIASHALLTLESQISGYVIFHRGAVVRSDTWPPARHGASTVLVQLNRSDIAKAEAVLGAAGFTFVPRDDGLEVGGERGSQAVNAALTSAGVVPLGIQVKARTLQAIFQAATSGSGRRG